MKYIERWFFPALFLLMIVGGTSGAVCYAQSDGLRKDVDTRLADLRQAKSGLDSAFADWTTAENDLKSSIHTFDETTDLRARINKDTSDMQTYTSEILGDINFLQSQWSLLTQTEKDYVASVEKSLP